MSVSLFLRLKILLRFKRNIYIYIYIYTSHGGDLNKYLKPIIRRNILENTIFPFHVNKTSWK